MPRRMVVPALWVLATRGILATTVILVVVNEFASVTLARDHA